MKISKIFTILIPPPGSLPKNLDHLKTNKEQQFDNVLFATKSSGSGICLLNMKSVLVVEERRSNWHKNPDY